MKKLSFLAIALAVLALVGCDEKNKGVGVSSIVLSETEVNRLVGDSLLLVAITDPAGATVKWASSNSAVATVTNGVVKMVTEGSAVITATAGDKTAQCKVNVFKSATNIDINKAKVSLSVGDSVQLEAITEPKGLRIRWESANPAIASVVEGLVVAHALGEVEIKAISGEKEAICKVTVIDPTAIKSVTLSQHAVTIEEGDSVELQATTDPAGIAVTWSSSNGQVATVANGNVVAIKKGSATIYATAGEKIDSCVVTVTEKPVEYPAFNIDGFGLFGESFEMIAGTDTVIKLSDGNTYDVQLGYIYWYGWDGDLQFIDASGWAGDGILINGGKVPVYIIQGGKYDGYYVGTSYWTIGYEKNDNDTIRPYNMLKSHVDAATYGDWVSYVYGDSIAPIDQELIWSKNYGTNFTYWYTSEDFCYADYGLYFGYFNKMVYREAYEDEGIEAAFAADVNWAKLADDRQFGFAFDLEHYEKTYKEGEGGEMLFTRPYDFAVENKVYDDNDVFAEYEDYLNPKEEAPKYYLGAPLKSLKEKPVIRGNQLPKDKLHIAR